MILEMPLLDWLRSLFPRTPEPPTRLGADEDEIVNAADLAAAAAARAARATGRHVSRQEERIRELERRIGVLEEVAHLYEQKR